MRVFSLTQVESSGEEGRIGLQKCLKFNLFSKVSFGELENIREKLKVSSKRSRNSLWFRVGEDIDVF